MGKKEMKKVWKKFFTSTSKIFLKLCKNMNSPFSPFRWLVYLEILPFSPNLINGQWNQEYFREWMVLW